MSIRRDSSKYSSQISGSTLFRKISSISSQSSSKSSYSRPNINFLLTKSFNLPRADHISSAPSSSSGDTSSKYSKSVNKSIAESQSSSKNCIPSSTLDNNPDQESSPLLSVSADSLSKSSIQSKKKGEIKLESDDITSKETQKLSQELYSENSPIIHKEKRNKQKKIKNILSNNLSSPFQDFDELSDNSIDCGYVDTNFNLHHAGVENILKANYLQQHRKNLSLHFLQSLEKTKNDITSLETRLNSQLTILQKALDVHISHYEKIQNEFFNSVNKEKQALLTYGWKRTGNFGSVDLKAVVHNFKEQQRLQPMVKFSSLDVETSRLINSAEELNNSLLTDLAYLTAKNPLVCCPTEINAENFKQKLKMIYRDIYKIMSIELEKQGIYINREMATAFLSIKPLSKENNKASKNQRKAIPENISKIPESELENIVEDLFGDSVSTIEKIMDYILNLIYCYKAYDAHESKQGILLKLRKLYRLQNELRIKCNINTTIAKQVMVKPASPRYPEGGLTEQKTEPKTDDSCLDFDFSEFYANYDPYKNNLLDDFKEDCINIDLKNPVLLAVNQYKFVPKDSLSYLASFYNEDKNPYKIVNDYWLNNGENSVWAKTYVLTSTD